MESQDIYAKANPALNSIIIWHFVRAYTEENNEGCEIPLLYVILPIILSSKLESSFYGTNVKTGFYKWLNRNPQVINQLEGRIAGIKTVSKNAFLFSLSTEIIQLNKASRLICNASGFKKSPNIPSSKPQIKNQIANAKKLGTWFGQVGDTRDILVSLRLV